jgi:predicted nucleic acid-binding protein
MSFKQRSAVLERSTRSASEKTSTLTSIRTPRPGSGVRTDRGLIDTSVAVVLETIDLALLPAELAISALTLAELTAGPYAAGSSAERSRRQEHLQRVEADLESLAFDSASARAYGRIYAATLEIGRKARGARAIDLMIAATARSHELPLCTLNAADFLGLEDLVEVVDLG